MRRLTIGTFLPGAMALGVMAASAAAAQSADTLAAESSAAAPSAAGATRSVEDYLCAFAGKCDSDTPSDASADVDATVDAAATADIGVDAATVETTGDSLAELTKPAPETRGFSLARPTAAPVKTARPVVPRGPQRIVTTRVAPTRVAPSATPSRTRPRLAARTPVATTPAPVRFSYAGAPPSVAPRVDLMLTFKKNSAEMTEQAQQEAAVFAQSLLAPELRIKRFVIEGHTDSAGGRAYNLTLSQRRAQAVAAFLASKGVESSRLQVRGMASDEPRPGLTPDSPDNRRVEAVLTS